MRLFHSILLALLTLNVFAWAEEPTKAFPTTGILPKQETGALRFLREHPTFDGRGVVVAIFDNGVDPSVPELQRTTDGKPKIIDMIDGTGSGDVPMGTLQQPDDGKLTGLSGRILTPNPKWKNPRGTYRLGLKAGYDIFPHDLVDRLKQERKEEAREQLSIKKHQLASLVKDKSKESDISKDEREAQLRVLESAIKDFEDPGPLYDCVTFHDGMRWQAVVDTDQDGDLCDEKVLTNFRVARQYAQFSEASQLHFGVNIYDDGKTLSLVTVCGDHGTHVAGIVSAYDVNHPERNGLAPGAQIISVKIGDTRLDGMETGVGLTRGLKAVRDNKCDLINMSYGEPSTRPNHGALIEQFNEIVREQGVIFVASAGNSGPALSTVGAPGGSTSALIGVGAYVSPEMMATAYAFHKPTQGVTYSWSSRSPTIDGATGVDIFAPGGAIAPIAKYKLRPTGRKHGTSMASPNACGNIALLLSALKQERKHYSPALVKRSLQNTANNINTADTMSQGPGLLQVDRAYQWLCEMSSAAFLREYTISVPTRNDARGIYLREPWETSRDFYGTVKVAPLFSKDKTVAEQLEFGVPVRLKATADWIEVGEHLVLDAGEASFFTRVNAGKLKPGLSSGEVQGFHADHPEAGPLFTVPVTVTKPMPLKANSHQQRIRSKIGEAHRTFLTVPAGAQQATLTLKNLSEHRTLYYVHAVQLEPGRSFEEHEMKTQVVLSENETTSRSFKVVSSRTLEVCLGHFWMNQDAAECELDVEFSGLHSNENSVHLTTAGEAVPVSVTSLLQYETCRPKIQLDTLQRSLKPVKTARVELSPERDLVSPPTMSHLQTLTYTFENSQVANVRFQIPRLDQLLYESPLESLVLFIEDAQGQQVATRDSFADSIKLRTGTYTLRLEMRHSNADTLKSFANTEIVAHQALGRTINIPAWTTKTGGSFNSEELQIGESATFWLRFPHSASLPTHVHPGDQLSGSVKWTDSSMSDLPLVCTVSGEASPKETSKPSVADMTLREFQLAKLNMLSYKKDQKQIDELLKTLRAATPDDRQLNVLQLHLLDDDDRKERLGDVVEAADRVIHSIRQRRLRTYFGVRRSPTTAEQKKLHATRVAERKDLIDALYRKGRALAYMELPDVLASHPIQNQAQHDVRFEKNFEALSQWVDTTEKSYVLLHIRRLRRQGNFAQAIEHLNKLISAHPDNYLYQKKRRDLYEELDWTDLRENAHRWLLRRFPNDAVLQ